MHKYVCLYENVSVQTKGVATGAKKANTAVDKTTGVNIGNKMHKAGNAVHRAGTNCGCGNGDCVSIVHSTHRSLPDLHRREGGPNEAKGDTIDRDRAV